MFLLPPLLFKLIGRVVYSTLYAWQGERLSIKVAVWAYFIMGLLPSYLCSDGMDSVRCGE